ncbi:hypothetical protein VU06_02330 [Desulfobulbus sp. F3]|nr:hypothetical protein [Desulfobulbus sp. F3]
MKKNFRPFLETTFSELKMQEIITPEVVSTSAIVISLLSLLFQGMLWRRSNRPVVSAYLCDADPENKNSNSVAFKLILANTGNMPATNIRLSVKESDIEKIFEDGTEEILKNTAMRCFGKYPLLPLLLNDERIETAFGFSEHVGTDKRTGLKYDTWFPVKKTYYDLTSRKYTSSLKLRIRDREGFGGSVFTIQKTTRRT